MTQLSRLLIGSFLLCGLKASAQEPPLALVGATVYPVSGPPIRLATIVIADGRIVAVGATVSVPANARRIDLRGATVIPGLVDARSSLFLSDSDLAGAGSADQSVLDAADLFREEAGKVLAQGVTTLYLSPGSRGGVGGAGAVVKLHPPDAARGEGWARVLRQRAALDLSLGISANGRSTSLERLNSYESLRSLFRGARQYGKSLVKYEQDLREFRTPPPAPKPAPGTAPNPAAPPQRPVKPRTNPAQENILAALNGTLPVRIEAQRADDILNALRLMDEFHVKAILLSADESGPLAGEIARRGIPVIWGPTLAGPPRLDTRGHQPETAAILAKSGVMVALSPGSRTGLASRFLRENAELAVAYGLASDRALRAITLDAAKTLGVADRVGSIEVGKDADLVVLSASPMDRSAKVQRVFVDGREIAFPRPQVRQFRSNSKAVISANGSRNGG